MSDIGARDAELKSHYEQGQQSVYDQIRVVVEGWRAQAARYDKEADRDEREGLRTIVSREWAAQERRCAAELEAILPRPEEEVK